MKEEKIFAILKMVGNFTAKNDIRMFLNYIHTVYEDGKTILFASDGYIAIEVKVSDKLNLPNSIVPRLSYGIKTAPELDIQRASKIREPFKNKIKESNNASFDIKLLNKAINSINSFAGFCKEKCPVLKIRLGSQSASMIEASYDEVDITALIMPRVEQL